MNDRWYVIGYDVFGGHEYPIDGPLDSELKAWSAARKHLRDIEGLQPTEETGGQAQYGIQDQILLSGRMAVLIDTPGKARIEAEFVRTDTVSFFIHI